MKRIALLFFIGILCAQAAWAARAKVADISQDPYISALVVDADTGKVLFEDHAGTVVYPASVLKIMDMLVVLEQIEQGKVKLDEMVQVTPEAAQMGGSQVYLDPKEQFTVEDLLYALAVQSANDAAVALAMHVAGSTEGFVALMNKRAAELGMKDTHFYSVHGLPPSRDKSPTRLRLAISPYSAVSWPKDQRYLNTPARRSDPFGMANLLCATTIICWAESMAAMVLKPGIFRLPDFP